MKTLVTFIPDNVIHALGWTIFHSVWQGMIIGLILFLIFRYRRNISSQTRYLLGVFALAAIFISSLLTFFIAYHPLTSQFEFVTLSPPSISSLAGIFEGAEDLSVLNPISSGWQQSVIRTFDFVSIIWFIGVLLLALRLAGGMRVIHGMRRQGVSPLSAAWEERMQLLAHKAGLHRSITYLQSQTVSIPTVIGIFKPVVIIPAMIISGLPAEQLETIIVHELAHIRRHDFLINILQSIMEALFFYHPVVWIISENVRQEREKCCDDYAVKVCGKVSLYIRALACLSELQISAVIPSVAITGNKKSIIHRVERLINNKKMKSNTTERLIAGLALVISVLVITLSTGATLKPSSFTQMESKFELTFLDKKAAVPVTDPEPLAEPATFPEPATVAEPTAAAGISLPSPVSEPAIRTLPSPPLPADTSHLHHRDKIEIKDNTVTREFHNKEGDDHEMKFVVKQGKVKELYVDGQRIPDNEFPKYQEEIDVTLEDLQDMERDLKHAKEELEHVDFDKIREDIHIEMEHFKEHEMKDLHEEMQNLHDEQLKHHINEEEMRREIEEAMLDVKIDQEKMQEEITKAMEEFEQGNHELSEEEFKQAMKDMELGLAEAKEGMEMMETEEMQRLMDEALQSVQEIDFEEMQREIEEAMKEIKEIDFAEIEKEMQFAMQNMEEENLNLDKEKKNIDEMIEELEKLELDKK
jgi:bla regulator protein BlaR1